MLSLFLLVITICLSMSKELSLSESIELALKNSPLIKSARKDMRAQELELKAAKGALFPRLKLEASFTRTDLPAYAFMNKLNQERISAQDFNPARLNNPSAINNFETKVVLEVPIWLGGKLQATKRMAELEYRAVELEAKRKEEEVIRQVYIAYVDAALAKEAIKVSQQAVEDASERLRLAEQMRKAGMALLSDVLNAQVHLSKAEESLEKAKRDYQIAKKGLEVAMGVSLGDFEVKEMKECPEVKLEGLIEKATARRDIKAMEERLKTLQEAYRFTLSDNLPQLYAFAQYALNSKNYPLGSGGKGYLAGLSLSWSFDTGRTAFARAGANLERKAGLEERIRLMRNMAVFEVERAYAEYLKSKIMMASAEDRIRASQEVLKLIELRYKNGLARMVDVLDAQTELDKARFEKLQSINACHKAYIDMLFSTGTTEEVKP